MPLDTSIVLSPKYSGSFELVYAQSLATLSCRASQEFVRPDVFDQEGNWYRLVDVDGKWALIKAMPSSQVSWISSGDIEPIRVQRRIEQILRPVLLPEEALQHIPAGLAKGFKGISPLVHVASASLGEALIKAVIRQVISASQARKLLHRFITRFGTSCSYDGTTCYSFPSLHTIIQLPLDDLVSCGLGFKAKVIQQVARSLLENNLEEQVRNVPTDVAITMLQRLKGIGHWTAHVTLCDVTSNWSLYPFDDLAVRRWAMQLWPEGNWPTRQLDFLRVWQEMNGAYTGNITFYFLTFGSLTRVL